ncbi:MAG TPA: thiamine biosynthesis protein ThiS [Ruminococcaceae bacterium]|mgnify:CR=1 FL=1|nr:thiamine biosynthesis protein ThiS [Oscillospiraceae bacterium]
MKLQINGQFQEVTPNTTLAAYLVANDIDISTVVVERNGEIPDKSTWNTLALMDGDTIEIVKFMGGGCSHFGDYGITH